MSKYKNILLSQTDKLDNALKHLADSYKNIQTLPTKSEQLDEESLETWERFATRFSRVMDIFIANYLRSSVLLHDSDFRGSLHDFVDIEDDRFLKRAHKSSIMIERWQRSSS